MTSSLHKNVKVIGGEANFSSMGLKEVPVTEIMELAAKEKENFVKLNLSNNKLTSIPKSIGKLKLTHLDVSGNHLKNFPGFIYEMNTLVHLNASNNDIKDATVNKLASMSALSYLNFKGNPLFPSLKELVGPCNNDNACRKAVENLKKKMAGPVKPKEAVAAVKTKKRVTYADQQKSCGKVRSCFGRLFSCLFTLAILSGLAVYALSFSDNKKVGEIKSQISQNWNKYLEEMLGEQTAKEVNDIIVFSASFARMAANAAGEMVYNSVHGFYVYITTDKYVLFTAEKARNNTALMWKDIKNFVISKTS